MFSEQRCVTWCGCSPGSVRGRAPFLPAHEGTYASVFFTAASPVTPLLSGHAQWSQREQLLGVLKAEMTGCGGDSGRKEGAAVQRRPTVPGCPCGGGDHDRLPEGPGRTEVGPDSRSEVTGEIN